MFRLVISLMGWVISITVPLSMLFCEPARSSDAHPRAADCEHGSEADIEPKGAKTARFVGREARLFVEAVQPGVDTTFFDTVVILRGPDVLGGTVAVVLKDGCLAGRKFLSTLEYICAIQMVKLFQSNATLQHSDHMDNATLQSMAEAGDPVAQFHVGLSHAWGRGASPNRGAAIEWLKRAAQREFSPAMLALGMALSGPGFLEDEAERVGQPPRSDEFTDLTTAYFWLNVASDSSDRDVKGEATFRLHQITGRMSPKELSRGRQLVRERKGAPH